MKVWIVATVQKNECAISTEVLYADIIGVYDTEEKAQNKVTAIIKFKSEDAEEELEAQGAVETFDTAVALEWEVE